jgi:hypothetical protein
VTVCCNTDLPGYLFVFCYCWFPLLELVLQVLWQYNRVVTSTRACVYIKVNNNHTKSEWCASRYGVSTWRQKALGSLHSIPNKILFSISRSSQSGAHRHRKTLLFHDTTRMRSDISSPSAWILVGSVASSSKKLIWKFGNEKWFSSLNLRLPLGQNLPKCLCIDSKLPHQNKATGTLDNLALEASASQ